MKDKKLRCQKQTKCNKTVKKKKTSKSNNILDSPKRKSKNIMKQFFKKETTSTLNGTELTSNLLQNFVKVLLIHIENKQFDKLEKELNSIQQLGSNLDNIIKIIQDFNHSTLNNKEQKNQQIGLSIFFDSNQQIQDELIPSKINNEFFGQINGIKDTKIKKKRSVSVGKYSANFLDSFNDQFLNKSSCETLNKQDQGLKVPKSQFVQSYANHKIQNILKKKSHQQFRNRKNSRNQKLGKPLLPCKQSKCQLQHYKKTQGYSKQKLIKF